MRKKQEEHDKMEIGDMDSPWGNEIARESEEGREREEDRSRFRKYVEMGRGE